MLPSCVVHRIRELGTFSSVLAGLTLAAQSSHGRALPMLVDYHAMQGIHRPSPGMVAVDRKSRKLVALLSRLVVDVRQPLHEDARMQGTMCWHSDHRCVLDAMIRCALEAFPGEAAGSLAAWRMALLPALVADRVEVAAETSTSAVSASAVIVAGMAEAAAGTVVD